MRDRVKGKVIVITGAASGQGAAEAERLAAEGGEVVAGDLSVAWNRVQTEAVERVYRRDLDVADPAQWRRLADWISDRFGRVDGLINNAGTTSRGGLPEGDITQGN